MAVPILAIANRNYSSWSLRAWLQLRLSGVPFETLRLPMDTSEWDRRIAEFSPSGRLPALADGDVRVWDSLAIILYAVERYSGAPGWPADPAARAEAISVSAEMHSGFMALRQEMPMNCRARVDGWAVSEAARTDVERVQEIWEYCRRRYGAGGPFLFGALGAADVMFAPVALRFATYGTALRAECAAYVETIHAMAEIQEWIGEALRETEVMEGYEPRKT
jgi:glutathione S-transferase